MMTDKKFVGLGCNKYFVVEKVMQPNTAVVEVFKTNIHDKSNAHKLSATLYKHFPDCKINFDLDDCDKILRFEGHPISTSKVIEIVNKNGFMCSLLH